MNVVYVVLALAAVFGTSEEQSLKHVCRNITECGHGECCYIRPEFIVVSKRQAILPTLHQHHDTGVCEKYHVQDEHCYPLETANNHCGCLAGLRCQWVPQPTSAHTKRSMAYHPGPGSYKCTKRP